MSSDAVNPQHYRNPNNVQVIELIRLLPFSLGNAIKYVYRNERKHNQEEDLKKALWYLDDYVQHPFAMEEEISASLVASVIDGCGTWERQAVVSLVDVYSAVQLQLDLDEFTKSHQRANRLIQERLRESKNTVSGE